MSASYSVWVELNCERNFVHIQLKLNIVYLTVWLDLHFWVWLHVHVLSVGNYKLSTFTSTFPCELFEQVFMGIMLLSIKRPIQ